MAGMISGQDPNLPSYIVEKMLNKKLRPTLTQLSQGTGTPISTLRENLNGSRAMKLDTATRIAEYLNCDLTELVKNARLS